jgi:predicted PurR-regulated permease PerM
MVGGAVWGIVGMLIAVPMLAMVKIYCAHDETLAGVALILGRE